jgi:hypothetical protein
MSAEPEAPQAATEAPPEQPDGVVVRFELHLVESGCYHPMPHDASRLYAAAQREKGAEFVLPVVIGTCAFYLGKKVCWLPD